MQQLDGVFLKQAPVKIAAWVLPEVRKIIELRRNPGIQFVFFLESRTGSTQKVIS